MRTSSWILCMIVVMLSSCGTNRLTYRKVQQTKVKPVFFSNSREVEDVSNESSIVRSNPPHIVDSSLHFLGRNEEDLTILPRTLKTKVDNNTEFDKEYLPAMNEHIDDDTLYIKNEEKAVYIAKKAKRTEHAAQISVFLFVASSLSIIMSMILTIFPNLLVFSIVLILLAGLFYFSSIGVFIGVQFSKYITVKGNRWRIASLILVLLSLLFLSILILASFL